MLCCVIFLQFQRTFLVLLSHLLAFPRTFHVVLLSDLLADLKNISCCTVWFACSFKECLMLCYCMICLQFQRSFMLCCCVICLQFQRTFHVVFLSDLLAVSVKVP